VGIGVVECQLNLILCGAVRDEVECDK